MILMYQVFKTGVKCAQKHQAGTPLNRSGLIAAKAKGHAAARRLLLLYFLFFLT